MSFRSVLFLVFLPQVILLQYSFAQQLKPGFDKEEFLELLKISSQFSADNNSYKNISPPQFSELIYQSEVVGLDNQWQLWMNKNDVAIISTRGTTQNQLSWLANFYAALVPASGEIKLANNKTFNYKLSHHPHAAVHIGWLISMAYLSEDMLIKIDSVYNHGIREILLTGHSQGGGITYLLTAYFHYLQEDGKLPKDIRFKTYCSAAPKPGNLYFAYTYEDFSFNWAYNVVNAADWVPETPVTIQTIKDFNTTNPFKNAKSAIRKQKFPQKTAFKYVYNRLDKPTRKAQKNYQKYLGKMMAQQVQKHLEEYVQPEYFESNNYVRTGTMVSLLPDENYYELFPDGDQNVFIHHLFEPYQYLIENSNL